MASVAVPNYVHGFTQKQQVLWFLRTEKSITSLDAIKAFTLTRLSAIIGFLEKDGYVFDHTREINPESGKSYTRYSYPNGQLNLGLGQTP